MAVSTSGSDTGDASDLNSIFIGRERQLDLFEFYLGRWQQLLRAAQANEPGEEISAAPSPNNKIQGFVTMLFGRGGFGKSTLLGHYQALAMQEQYHYKVCPILDWEFAVGGRRGIFIPGARRGLEAQAYYNVLCEQLMLKLGKKPAECKAYQAAISAVEQAHKEAHSTIEGMRTDDRYAWLRGLTLEGINTAIKATVPGSGVALALPVVKTAEEQAAQLTQEQVELLVTRLRARLKQRIDDFLTPELRLGLALGRDLAGFARNQPMLFFFDTYEEIAEGDALLRIVMLAAGLRVGWVIAGRDNLWGGAEQRERSLGLDYGYADIVPSNRGLPVNFNAADIGAFGLDDIMEYFQQLSQQSQQSVVEISEEGANRVLEVTEGIPLAVKIAAELYRERGTLEVVTEEVEGQHEIIDRMVRRYLLHARDDQQQRLQLYGLALVRRADQPHAVAAALGLTPEQAQQHYQQTLTRLHRRYSFIFTTKDVPGLHQEVRDFLRLWLLERRTLPELVALNERIRAAQEEALQHLEAQRGYTTLEQRLQDDEWVNCYLDYAEQCCWQSPATGMQTLLAFILAAALYRRAAIEDSTELGAFFQQSLGQPYRSWWQWACEGLAGNTFRVHGTSITHIPVNADQRMHSLVGLHRLAEERCPTFPAPIPDYRKELEATIWWYLGDAYRGEDDNKALTWYEQALTRLPQHPSLQQDTARAHYNIAYTLDDEKRYTEVVDHLTQALTLDPNYTYAYNNRGIACDDLHEYERAIADYDHALILDPNYANAYNNRGLAYAHLHEYEHAIFNYDHALALDPNYANAYNNRGIAYRHLHEYERAIADYDHALALDPNYALTYNNRGNVYYNLHEYERAIADYDHALALDPNDANTYFNRGVAYRHLHEYEQATVDYDHALALNPNDTVAYFNRGLVHLLINNIQQAIFDFSAVYRLDPDDLNARWMALWAAMGKEPLSAEALARLAHIAESDAIDDYQSYIVHVCKGITCGWRGKLKEGLATLEEAILLEEDDYDVYFWKGMLSAYYYRGQSHEREIIEAIELALKYEMPPCLLRPLYWLERDRPEFFARYARALLEKYGV